jgi:hypothetical protein
MTRAEDRGPDADDGRALLDGDLEVVAHPHRELSELRLVHTGGRKTIPNVPQFLKP